MCRFGPNGEHTRTPVGVYQLPKNGAVEIDSIAAITHTLTQADANMYSESERKSKEPVERPWIVLKTTYDVEAWIDQYNRELRRTVEKTDASGYGICFRLAQGGEIFMHTTPEGDVLLDVTPEAGWVTPLLVAATAIEAPPSQIWTLPGHTLTQLVLGLSSLIVATRLVLQHDFRVKKY